MPGTVQIINGIALLGFPLHKYIWKAKIGVVSFDSQL